MKKLLLLLLLTACSVSESEDKTNIKKTGDPILDGSILDALNQMGGSVSSMDQWVDINIPTPKSAIIKMAEYYFLDDNNFKWLIVDVADGNRNGIVFNNEVVEKEIMEGKLRTIPTFSIVNRHGDPVSSTGEYNELYAFESTKEKQWLSPKLGSYASGEWEETDPSTSYRLIKKTATEISMIRVWITETPNTYNIDTLDFNTEIENASTYIKY